MNNRKQRSSLFLVPLTKDFFIHMNLKQWSYNHLVSQDFFIFTQPHAIAELFVNSFSYTVVTYSFPHIYKLPMQYLVIIIQAIYKMAYSNQHKKMNKHKYF